MFDLKGKRIWVAGHRGMVGSALCRRLASEGCDVAFSHTADLRFDESASGVLSELRPHAAIICAAKCGGIGANIAKPATFLFDNLAIALQCIHQAKIWDVEKLLYLGSSCIYPRDAEQTIKESALLTGPLEPTNEPYAIAKIAGVKLCQAYRKQYNCDFISAMPTNLYGPGDNYDQDSSHVVAALIRRIHKAKESGAESVTIWGTGTPRREFLYVDDCADALVHLLKHYSDAEPVNVGTGSDVTICELAHAIAKVVGYEGRFTLDTSKPDGTPRKLLDVSKMDAMGWKASTSLEDGLRKAYGEFLLRTAVDRRCAL